MVSPMSLEPPPIRPRRSRFVTIVAWVFIATGTLLLPISAISLLMILAKSHGTASTEALGFFSVIVAPPLTLATGIGLLCRQAWAWPMALLLSGFVVVMNGCELLTHRATTETTVSTSGVPTTILAAPPNYHSVPIIAAGIVLIGMLLTRSVRTEFLKRRMETTIDSDSAEIPNDPSPQRNWRVGHQGRDQMYYEERLGDTWQRIDIDGEMLMGRAHHVIYFASPEQWQRYPEWARHRRDEIIARIQSEFRPPDYEYADNGVVPSPSPAPGAVTVRTAPKQWGALALTVAILLGIAGGMGWLVKSGLERDATWLPTKRASTQRVVERQSEPATYWLSIGIYAVIGVGAGGLALWMAGVAVCSGRR